MAFHYFLLPYCYGSESSGADLEIGRHGSVHACAYTGWHAWDVGTGQEAQGLPRGSSSDSNIQVNTDRKAVENYSYGVMRITSLQREQL